MFIISWNVAGWSSTSRMIRENFGSVAEFLRRTGADIFCLQEVKGSWGKLESDPCGMGASENGGQSAIDGWESFWSFSSREHRGFNGVATFVRKGFTWWCDSRPFSEEQLNDEGRVVVTGHSGFVLVNTYVVNSRGGSRAELKMRFLNSLKELIIKLRKETGKPVILAGDLNQTYRAQDACWSLRRLDLSAVVELCHRAQNCNNEMERNKWLLSFPCLSVPALLRLQKFMAEQLSLTIFTTDEEKGKNKNCCNNKNKTFAFSTVSNVNCGNFSNDFDNTADNNNNNNNGNETSYDGDFFFAMLKVKIRERQEEQRRNGLSCAFAATLEELCAAGVSSVSVDFLTRSQPVTHNCDLFALTQYCGLPPHTDTSVQFMKCLLSDVHLHDALLVNSAEVAENGEEQCVFTIPCPYTCWDQSTNARQRNEGTRIDYILIDEALLPALIPCSSTDNNIGVATIAGGSFSATATTEKGNLFQSAFFDEFNGYAMKTGVYRAMAGGVYPVAPFDGSGLPPVDVHARDVQFCGLPSTGLFVTPPQYSDHCGVCAFFRDISSLFVKRTAEIEERNRCQYRPPITLHAFFFFKRRRQEFAAEGRERCETAITTQNVDASNDMEVVIVEKKAKNCFGGCLLSETPE